MIGYKYDTTEPKLPLEVYTVYMEWKSKEPVPVIETFEDEICGGQINEQLPKRFSTKCSGILVASAIKASTSRGGSVLDPFCGSGSTLIAAEQTGRKCYTMELDPKYCDVIINRWEKLTKLKAEKL